MDITICGNCGWLGSAADIATTEGTPTNEAVRTIVRVNELKCRCCPKCLSTELFTKPMPAPYQYSPNEGSWLNAPHARYNGPEINPCIGVPDETGTSGMRVSERPADIPTQTEPEISIASKIPESEEELPDLTGEDVELTAEIVAEVLKEASKAGQSKTNVAKDLADGLSAKNKKLIAEVAELPVEELKDSLPKPKVKVNQRDPIKKKTFKCDVCEKEFESKVISSRCPKCTKEYMDLMVGS
jgi:hypothetical protein